MSKAILAFFAVTLLVGCATNSKTAATEALTLPPASVETRVMQCRKFQTQDEKTVLLAAAGLLQDMGYVIEEAETSLGVVVGEKDRDATEGGQVVGSIMLAMLTGIMMPTDQVQKIRASLVTAPPREGFVQLRVTFQRVIWNTQGQVARREPIHEQEIYTQFFDLLAKAVFLEAQEI